MRVLAEIGEQVQSRIERHVFVPILTNVNLMVTAMTSGSGTIAVVASTDGVLPSKRAGICTAGYKIHIGREEHTGGRPRGRHREVCRACSGGPFSGAWMSVSDRASWGRAVQRTRSPRRRTHREV